MFIHDNILFIHIPKTAGTSITNFFFDKYGIDSKYIGEHPDGKHNKITDVPDYGKYNSFTVIRNPYEATVSHYKYLKKYEGYKFRFKTFVNLMMHEDTVREPMLDYITDANGVAVKNILRYENLLEDFTKFMADNGLSAEGFEKYHVLKTKHKHYSKYYTMETYMKVTDYFQNDLHMFGYQFNKFAQ